MLTSPIGSVKSTIGLPQYQLVDARVRGCFIRCFRAIKAILAKDAFIRYPDHNKPFHIYTDASDLQLGSVIMQDNAPVAYFSHNFNAAQCNHYTTSENEILSIVETFKEYRTMLFGCCELHVYTDHKNLTFNPLSTQRVLRWRLFIEEFGVTFHYIKGSDNMLADALSRLPFPERRNTHPFQPQKPSDAGNMPPDADDPNLALKDSDVDSFYSMAIDDDNLLECFIHLPEQQGIPFNIDYQRIATTQMQDAALLEHAQKEPHRVT
jgi:RNase H-like domain found in reverse transcriptase